MPMTLRSTRRVRFLHTIPIWNRIWVRPGLDRLAVYHVVPGAEFGWRSGWSKWPEGHLDGLSGIADTDRGSPAGLTVYEHLAFPKQYRNTIFFL